jgi:hypothetical protein
MTLTLGQWIFAGIIAIAVIIVVGFLMYDDEFKGAIIALIIGILIEALFIGFFSWYNANTADGVRHYKDYVSNMENGLNRSVDIYAEDGRQIYHYDGKIDIEDNDGYILFEDENHKRHIIYYGALDTVIIEEK